MAKWAGSQTRILNFSPVQLRTVLLFDFEMNVFNFLGYIQKIFPHFSRNMPMSVQKDPCIDFRHLFKILVFHIYTVSLDNLT